MNVFRLAAVEDIVRLALSEDIGRGDLTTFLTVPEEVQGQAEIVAKQEAVVAGLPILRKVFAVLGADGVKIREHCGDGDRVLAGALVASLEGPARDLLVGERVALNFLQRLSGVATLTRRFAEAVAGTRARVVDTRKTTPGMRLLEKYAVRVGGGHNHRTGLDDGVLIKDNHIVAAGGITPAVARARAGAPHTIKVEVECADLRQVEEAVTAGADAILLDNMSNETMSEAVRFVAGRALLEASGNVSLERIRSIAETGVDLISVGALTHSAPAVDLSMRLRLT